MAIFPVVAAEQVHFSEQHAKALSGFRYIIRRIYLRKGKTMNKHLTLVREFHEKFSIAQPVYPETMHLSDMDIVMRQALLLECGSETFKAIAVSDQSKTLAGLVDLAYNALAAIACRGDDVIPVSVSCRQDGSALSPVKTLSEKINDCTSGDTVHYSTLYSLCMHLAANFIGADFDKAFQIVHNNLLTQEGHGVAKNYEQRIQQETLSKAPDLGDALFE